MDQAHRRHDIPDRLWKKLEPHLPGGQGKVGRPAQDNRLFINAILWIIRTGVPWRDLPADYGNWKNVHRRFSRWRESGVWERLFLLIQEEPDCEWLMIDATHIKVHPHAAGAQGGNEAMNRTKGGLNTKVHMAVDAYGMPLKATITKGTTHDSKEATSLVESFEAEFLIADRAYDSNAIVEQATKQGMRVVIPSKKNRKTPRDYDKQLYKVRHMIENTFLKLKQWRGIATRYAKKESSFLAIVQIGCLMLWSKII